MTSLNASAADRAMRGNPLATRADAQRLLLDLCKPLEPYFSPGRAQVKLGEDGAHFDRKAAWFEGFARPLWGLAPLHAGGGAFDSWKLFSDGIVSGVDPDHPEYWRLTENHNQRSVEIAALGFALALAPDKLWEPLSQRTREQLAAWVGHIQRVQMADNNWRFFPVMAGLGLKKVGVAIDEAVRDAHLKRLDEFYLRDGWYMDGPGGHIDHYNGFALQFYGLIYARHEEARDPARAKLYRDRATEFAQNFRHWFGRDGAALAIGRSLTYRFAMAGFWAALAYSNTEALPWGEIRGLWARQMRWWLDKPILNAAGHLSVGFAWPNYLMSEEYNSPGSPYWAFKAFLPLALPATHPFWTAPEAELAPLEKPLAVRGASMLIQREKDDAIALPAGPVRLDMRNSRDKYGKFAYSSRFGLCVEAERWITHGFIGDNILAVSADGVDYRARGAIDAKRIGDQWIETRWSPTSGVAITTLQSFVRGWELRIHDVSTDKPLKTVEAGHCVPARVGSRGKLRASLNALATENSGATLLVDDGHRSAIVDCSGGRSAGAADAAPNTNMMFPHAAVPYLAGALDAGRHLLVTASRAAFDEVESAVWSAPSADEIAAILKAADWPSRTIAGATSAMQTVRLERVL
ncbi:DUF2264 domain-containing protein [Terrarubrum flagellatum]|uniref:DUF2264 domain-containing protein n=1 Tax=Terrirubrum flagellatum TaxID=2895980 RepID=UPI0031455E0B